MRSPHLLEQNFLKGISLNLLQAGSKAPSSLWVRNARQALLWFLTACEALRVWGACDAQLARATPTILRRKVRIFTAQTLHDRRVTQKSWALATRIMEVAWKVVQIPFRVWDPVLPGTFGTRCGERKRNVLEVGLRGSERQHVTLFVWSRCLKQSHHKKFSKVFLVLTYLHLWGC